MAHSADFSQSMARQYASPISEWRAAEAVRAEIGEQGGRAIAYELDVRNEDAWADCVSATEAEFGPVSILCNNAGANFRVSFDDQSLEMWNIIMETGLTGAFLGIKAVVPSMRRAGGGAILNIGSLASIRPGAGSPGYAAQKMGMVGLNRSRSGQLRQRQHQIGHHIPRTR